MRGQKALADTDKTNILLEVRDLDISFHTRRGEVRAVNGISYSVRMGEILGLVGESGSGKSVEAFSILGLHKQSARINAGSVLFEGRDLLKMTAKERESLRGNEISMIFQNPMSYLDPVFTIEKQMTETIRAHDRSISSTSAGIACLEMLREVRIRNPEQVMKQYPFELSGGMCQRVMIAIALLCKPKLLIADEPTTALDVTIQSQIIQILKELQMQSGMSILYITHNFGIVAELCDSVAVMCGGYILEQGTTDDVFYRAAHPYTRMLHKMVPRIDSVKEEPFVPIEGVPTDTLAPPEGCVFSPRCSSCMDICKKRLPPETVIDREHRVFCWLWAQSGVPGVS